MLLHLTENDPETLLLKELRQLIECQYGLLDQLLSTDVINKEQVADIKESTNEFKQNDKLLDILRQMGRLRSNQKFLEALLPTFQEHIASLIICDGGRILILKKVIINVVVIVNHSPSASYPLSSCLT